MKIYSRLLLIALLVCAGLSASAQIVNPVKWTSKIEMTSADEGIAVFSATIAPHWHIYGLNLPDGGPRPTTFDFTDVNGVTLLGDIVPSAAPVTEHDATFKLLCE